MEHHLDSDVEHVGSETEDMVEEDDHSSSGCTKAGHVHRQEKPKVFDLDEEEILLEEEEERPFEYKDVCIEKGRRVDTYYDLLEVLGKGKFGMVYRCQEKSTARIYAAKFIEIKRPQERKEVENEIDLMRILRHPRLLQLYDAFDDGSKMAIIMELATGGELFSRVIDDEFVLTEQVCTLFMRQICEGVEFMHSKDVMHLDLKPENILCVTPTGNRIKLIDFGLSRLYRKGEITKAMFGTPEFVAPEVINYDPITPASDCWSVGVICYILLSGLSPFMGDNDSETLSNVTNAAWDFEDDCFEAISDDAKHFITMLLEKRPHKRMTASQCLQHKWLSRRRGSEYQLSKTKLKRFVIKRRWQKIFNTIRALHRMGSKFSTSDDLDTADDEDEDETENATAVEDVVFEQTGAEDDVDRVASDEQRMSPLTPDYFSDMTPSPLVEVESQNMSMSPFSEDGGICLESPLFDEQRSVGLPGEELTTDVEDARVEQLPQNTDVKLSAGFNLSEKRTDSPVLEEDIDINVLLADEDSSRSNHSKKKCSPNYSSEDETSESLTESESLHTRALFSISQ